MTLLAELADQLPPARQNADVRVVTLNLWGWFGDWDARRRVLAELLPAVDADVLLLQEVCCRPGIDQAEQLRDVSGLPFSAFGGVKGMAGQSEGVAVLSRFPLLTVRQEPLPRSEPRRGLLLAQVAAPAGALWVLSAHTAFAPQEVCEDQIQLLANLPQTPLVIGGDLNATPELVYPLTSPAGFLDPVATSQPSWPNDPESFAVGWQAMTGRAVNFSLDPRRLDYVLVRGPQVQRAGVLVPGTRTYGFGSDHAMVWADLRLSD